LLNGTLSADRLRIINSGEMARFQGNVVTDLIMESLAEPEPEPEPEPETPPPPKTRSVTGKSANAKLFL
jgi:lipopolysaccharide export system protein LptC